MRSVLLAWEFGAGFGHILTLRRIAARLMVRGFRCVAAVKDVGTASALADAGVEVLQAPGWKVPQSSATLGDTLGDAGFADARELRPRIEAWRQILSRAAPALVIADYAPGACLAARGRVPLALIGNGYTLPPGSMQTFPLLHQVSPPVRPEQQLLDVTNSVLHDLQLQPLQRFPELFSGDACWVHALPLLDPYARWREHPAQGPAMDRLPEPRAAGASEILVYLSSWSGPQRSFLDALRPFARHVRLFAAGFSAAERERFAAMGMRLQAQPFDLAKDFASARLVVHVGSEGTASVCVMAGVPQLICAVDVEKELIGKALAQAGIGKFMLNYDPAVTLTEDAVQSLLADQDMAARARAIGEAHRAQYHDADPLTEFEMACLKLVS
jgi:UDP:flavonoid glycosyltransferase YjiC (YdhE family)